MTVETEIAPAPQPDDSFAGDAEGLRKAAAEVLNKRGNSDETVDGPGHMSDDRGAVHPEEALKISEGAKALTDWRAQREQKRQEFERAVFGEEPGAKDAAQLDGIKSTKDLLDQVEAIAQKELADADRENAEAEKKSPSAVQEPPLGVIEQQLNGYVANQVAASRK
jgi:hypothetical protein